MLNKLLEAEELAFLAELMAKESDDNHSVTVQLPQASPLMPLLGQAQGLELMAQFKHHQLRFPVRLQISESLHPELIFDAPEIIEIGPNLRKWRFRPDESLRLFDRLGNESPLNLLDLSANGLSLSRSETDQPLPEQLDLQLELPDGGDRLALSARRVRELDSTSAAYQLEMQGDVAEDRLRWFLFNQHPVIQEQRKPHPETSDEN